MWISHFGMTSVFLTYDTDTCLSSWHLNIFVKGSSSPSLHYMFDKTLFSYFNRNLILVETQGKLTVLSNVDIQPWCPSITIPMSSYLQGSIGRVIVLRRRNHHKHTCRNHGLSMTCGHHNMVLMMSQAVSHPRSSNYSVTSNFNSYELHIYFLHTIWNTLLCWGHRTDFFSGPPISIVPR